MRQAVIAGADRFEVQTVPAPRLRSDGDILVRTAISGICSGDLMPWYLEKKIGSVLGHEVAGYAMEVGPAVSHIRPGDLVFMHHHAPCMRCPACARAAFVHCRTWKSSRLDPGGMADCIRVPAENVAGDTFAVNDLTPEQAMFIEPLACSVKALRRVSQVVGMTGVVVGCGVMGLLNLAVARAFGAKRLIAIEPDAFRRDLAMRYGATEIASPEQAPGRLLEAADFVIIGPGHPEVIRQALSYVRPAGTAILFTPTSTGTTTSLDLGNLYFREISLTPSYSCGPRDTREAYELLRTGRVRLDGLITHRFPLERIQEAYLTAKAGGPALKVVIELPEGHHT